MAETARTPASKAAIWEAALRLFPQRGYAATSVRDIGAEAGVDPALVMRHFGTKEQLFLQTMWVDLGMNPIDLEPRETLGPRFIDYVLTTDDRARGMYLSLLRASDSDEVRAQMARAHERAFVEPLLAQLDGSDRELRARLAGALITGLLHSLWVVGDDALATADRPAVVEHYGALLQQLITPRR